MRQLSGSDAFFLYSDKPGQHQHISTIYLYEPSTAPGGKVDFLTILEHVRDRIGTSRIFRQRLVDVPLNLDYPYWIHDKNFDLEFHVRHIALPHPGDWRQFCILASRLHARPVDLKRPVWEMYVIEGLDNVAWLPKGSFAVLEGPPGRDRRRDRRRFHSRPARSGGHSGGRRNQASLVLGAGARIRAVAGDGVV